MSIVDPFLVSRLIQLIKSHRCIYDPRHDHHNNRAVINSVWKYISTEMGQPETLCREKWINLRSNFARELRKTRRKIAEEGGNKVNTQWIHFEGMSFLAPFVRTRLATVECPNEVEEMRIKTERESSVEPDFHQTTQNGDESDSSLPTPSTNAYDFGRKRKHDEDVDDDKMFLLSLLPKMKQLPILDNLTFRIEIQTLLLEKLRTAINCGVTNSGSSSPQPSSGIPFPQNPVILHSWTDKPSNNRNGSNDH